MLFHRWRKDCHVKDPLQGGNWITPVGRCSHTARYCICSIIVISVSWKSWRINWKAVKRVLRYLKGIKNYKLTHGWRKDGLLGYCDAKWASQDHRPLISAYIFQINGGSISWSCQKQNVVALSSTEALFIALTHATREALWLQHFITEVFQPLKYPIWLYSDNQSAITIVYSNQQHARKKHFNLQLYFLWDTIENSQLVVKYLLTDQMLADILTKGLPGPKVKSLIEN